VDVVADLPADTQAAEVVQERELGFRHPPVDAKARAVFGAASGDLRADAQLTDPAAVGVVVVAAVGVHRLRAPSRPAALAADRRDGLDQRDQLGDVVAVAAGEGGGERNAAGEVQQVRGPQLGQQHLVQALPDPGLVPVPQPPLAGHARAEAQLLRQELPADPGVEHEQDPAHHLPVLQALTARTSVSALDNRQERLDPLPQPVLDLPRLTRGLLRFGWLAPLSDSPDET
jgi:hypothetical protein